MARHEVFIPRWRPIPLNDLMGRNWRKAARLKKEDFAMLAAYVRAIPAATGKRRVHLHITLTGQQKRVDPDSYSKSCLDGLVRCGRLVDDSDQWVEWVPPTYDRGGPEGTRVILEDVS